jgi:hypothetical protein
MNRKLKIGISLMIALAFVLPVAAIATPGKPGGGSDAGTRPTGSVLTDSGYRRDSTGMRTAVAQLDGGRLHALGLGDTTADLYVEDPDGNIIKVNEGDILLEEEFYKFWAKITPEAELPYYIQPELELYLGDCNEFITIYETGFEDNARNYMEWGQIDWDCGVYDGIPGGYYDGWAWSDARSSEGDHSFKNTMYDEYKNGQDDSLYMKSLVDVTDFETVKFSFDTWVDGEYADDWWASGGGPIYHPLDYLWFGVIDGPGIPGAPGLAPWLPADNGDGQMFTMHYMDGVYIRPGNYYFFDTSIPLWESPGADTPQFRDYTMKAEKIDGQPGWWHVWYELPVDYFTDPENVGMWFHWSSDKERVFEGAYVDNVQIEVYEKQYEKIWQGHSQEWIELTEEKLNDLGDFWFEFPLTWNDVVETFEFECGSDLNCMNYKAILKLKNNAEIGEDVYEATPDDLVLILTDDWGDGWWYNSVVDVFVNGDLILDGVTLSTGSYQEFLIPAVPDGALVEVCYSSDGGTFEDEHAWYLLQVPTSTILLSSGDGGTIPDHGCMDTIISATGDFIGVEEGYDMIKDIKFEIGERRAHVITDLELHDSFTGDLITNNGVVQEGSTIHISYCTENVGNIADDIMVKATAYELETVELANYDMESGFSYYYFLGNYGVPYLSDKFAWSGRNSLAFNDPETLHYGAYDGFGMLFADPVDMEGVQEAYWDHYYMGKLGAGDMFYTFIGSEVSRFVYGDTILIGPGEKIDPWVGPMQPQCFYEQIDLKESWDWLVSVDETLDANGNPTYDMLIGYMLSNDGDDKFYYDAEYDWSGAYIDDVTVSAVQRGDAVWTDQQMISGCDVNDACCDQFLWENVPFSCYELVVETVLPDPFHNHELSQRFCVLTDLDKMAKADGVDYTDCTPDSWCISDVVGNPWGDHYALATNCDTHRVPAGVNDYVSLGPGDDCLGVDISHFEMADPPVPPFAEFVQPPESIDTADNLPFSDTYSGFRMWDYYEIDAPIDTISFYGLHLYGATDDFDGTTIKVGFSEDAAGPAGPAIYEEFDITVNAATDSEWFGLLWGTYNVYEVTLELPSEVDLLEGYFSVQMDDSWEQLAMYPSQDGFDGAAHRYNLGTYQEDVAHDLAISLSGGDDSVVLGGGLGVETTVLYQDFEEIGWTWDVPPSGVGTSIPTGEPWTTSTFFWFNSLYGSAYEGDQWAFSYSETDSMVSPDFTLSNGTEFGDHTLTFHYRAESSTYPQNLQVLVNGATVVYEDTEFTHTSYVEATVDLGAWAEDTIFIEFVNPTPTGLYGQCVDMVEVTTTEADPVEEADPILLDMVWQMDLSAGAKVILEVYGAEDAESGWCDSCEPDPCVCPPGLTAWQEVATFSGLYANEIFMETFDLQPYLGANDTVMCLRLRLDTTDWAGSDFAGPGIGFHLHEYNLVNISYNELTGEKTDHFVDFADGLMEHQPGCIVAGEYWEQNESNHNQFYQEWPAEPIDNALIWSTSIDDAYYAQFFGNMEYDINAGTTLSVEMSADGGDSWYIIHRMEGPAASEGNLVLRLTDDFGDGWTDYTNWATMDVYVDGVLIYDDITCTGATADFPITVDGDVITVCYDNGGVTMWEEEHSWQLIFGDTVLLQDGQGGAIPVTGCQETAHPGFGMPKIGSTPFDITPWAGRDLLFRVHIVDETGAGGFVLVEDLMIKGKIDTTPPTTSISLSGSLVGPNTYDGPVQVTITATDDTGMGQIHYILNGEERVVQGKTATFTVSADGTHNIEYWGVDAAGNEGAHGTVSFFIDNTPPSVELIGPEPGLYLFGNKLLSMAKPFIIGGFTAEATADDAQGVQRVDFLLNGNLIGADTEEPYTMYIAVKNMGAATLTARAVDGVGNSDSDSMDITYYKFL